MATLGGDVLTLLDMAKRYEGSMEADIAEVLDQEKGIVSAIPFVPSNLPTSNVSTRRIGLPTTYLRRFNSGSASSKSTTSQVTDGMAMVDAWSTIDIKLAGLFGDPARARFNEGTPFMESMGQTAEGLMWYGSTADDEMEFNGFAIRPEYSALGTQCITAGGNAANGQSSIWHIKMAPNKIFGIYPKNLKGGLQHKSWGEQIHSESTTLGQAKLGVYQDQWMWDLGLVVKDPAYACRIANVEHGEVLAVGDSQTLTSYATNILFVMAKSFHRIRKGAGTSRFVMNRSVYEGLDVQTLARSSSNAFKYEDVPGFGPMATFRGVPIHISDQLLYTEGVIS